MKMKPDLRFVLQAHHFRRILEAAAKRGIEVVPLKGMDLVTFEYGDRPRPPMGDVDFLVRPERASEMCGLMEELGFVSRGRDIDAASARHERGYLLFFQQGSLLFEVHTHLVDPVRFPIDELGLWNRMRPSSIDGLPCHRLSPEDFLVFLALHSTLHRFLTLERTLNDISNLLETTQLSDFSLASFRAKEWGVSRALWFHLQLLQPLHNFDFVNDLRRVLCPEIQTQFSLSKLTNGTRSRLIGFPYRLQALLIWPIVFDTPLIALRLMLFRPLSTHSLF
jgi:hypothetical protein